MSANRPVFKLHTEEGIGDGRAGPRANYVNRTPLGYAMQPKGETGDYLHEWESPVHVIERGMSKNGPFIELEFCTQFPKGNIDHLETGFEEKIMGALLPYQHTHHNVRVESFTMPDLPKGSCKRLRLNTTDMAGIVDALHTAGLVPDLFRDFITEQEQVPSAQAAQSIQYGLMPPSQSGRMIPAFGMRAWETPSSPVGVQHVLQAFSNTPTDAHCRAVSDMLGTISDQKHGALVVDALRGAKSDEDYKDAAEMLTLFFEEKRKARTLHGGKASDEDRETWGDVSLELLHLTYKLDGRAHHSEFHRVPTTWGDQEAARKDLRDGWSAGKS